MKVIDSNKLERDAGGKPVPLFLIPLWRALPPDGRGQAAMELWNRSDFAAVGSLRAKAG